MLGRSYVLLFISLKMKACHPVVRAHHSNLRKEVLGCWNI